MTAFAALTRLCPPPREPRRRPIDWRQVEDVLGVRLPEDYKQLASAYGPGAFADYVCIYQPDGVTEWVDLTGPMRVPRLRSERGDDRAPVPQGHPRADDGLLPLGPHALGPTSGPDPATRRQRNHPGMGSCQRSPGIQQRTHSSRDPRGMGERPQLVGELPGFLPAAPFLRSIVGVRTLTRRTRVPAGERSGYTARLGT